MSGVEVPPLGSFKDKTLREFMTLESRRKLKSEELNLSIALLNCADKNASDTVNKIWKQLTELEFGVGSEVLEEKDNQEKVWQEMYAHMQKMDVRLARSGDGLAVQGLNL